MTGGAISVSIWYASWGESRYYNFVAVTGIVVAFISIVLNFTDLTGKLPKIPWNVIVSPVRVNSKFSNSIMILLTLIRKFVLTCCGVFLYWLPQL